VNSIAACYTFSDRMVLQDNQYRDASGLDYSKSMIDLSCFSYVEDGHHKDEVTFCASTAEATWMQKRGWVLYSDADERMIKVDNDQNATQVADDSEHNHMWGTGYENFETFDVNGNNDGNQGVTLVDSGSEEYVINEPDGTAWYTNNITPGLPAHITLIALKHR